MTKLAIPLAVSALGFKKAKSKLKLLQVVEAKEDRRVIRKKSEEHELSKAVKTREVLLHLRVMMRHEVKSSHVFGRWRGKRRLHEVDSLQIRGPREV